ncbi:MAG: hypothetical protein LBT97_03000 [Planctomycetota bacterium]|jgi:hypothetical protein|nr:hypothetical protein [Planctomycetota bacterium]
MSKFTVSVRTLRDSFAPPSVVGEYEKYLGIVGLDDGAELDIAEVMRYGSNLGKRAWLNIDNIIWGLLYVPNEQREATHVVIREFALRCAEHAVAQVIGGGVDAGYLHRALQESGKLTKDWALTWKRDIIGRVFPGKLPAEKYGAICAVLQAIAPTAPSTAQAAPWDTALKAIVEKAVASFRNGATTRRVVWKAWKAGWRTFLGAVIRTPMRNKATNYVAEAVAKQAATWEMFWQRELLLEYLDGLHPYVFNEDDGDQAATA